MIVSRKKINRSVKGAAWDSSCRMVRESLTEEMTFEMMCHHPGEEQSQQRNQHVQRALSGKERGLFWCLDLALTFKGLKLGSDTYTDPSGYRVERECHFIQPLHNSG